MAGLWRPRFSASGAETSVAIMVRVQRRLPCPTLVRFGVAPGTDAQGRCDGAGSEEIGCSPSVVPTVPKGFSCIGSSKAPISLVKLRSGGLGHRKREDSRAAVARLSSWRFWLMAHTPPFGAATRYWDHAAELWQSLHHPAANRTVPSVIVRSGGAALPGPAIDTAAPVPAVVAV